MIVLITGASHTGKTLLAQKLLARYQYPYLSIDLLKMGLIRSKQTMLTPEDDAALEQYLWPILREIIKTAIENEQNLIIEGAYIPFGWEKDFSEKALKDIVYCCLVMSQRYIMQNFSDIKEYADVIEQRIDDSWCTIDTVLAENLHYLELCEQHQYPYILIDDAYDVDFHLV